ncbi:hypothetical protein EMPG_17372 [Blastomyces silverae]|uniref:Uncharacterized protein n=1 Tax=Blastomyces silverae TaxID=2060906 RepID=A0A0H1B809_9EURO|nr:hypothetical protein EMPG_17372 [Blastomyces silverae]
MRKTKNPKMRQTVTPNRIPPRQVAINGNASRSPLLSITPSWIRLESRRIPMKNSFATSLWRMSSLSLRKERKLTGGKLSEERRSSSTYNLWPMLSALAELRVSKKESVRKWRQPRKPANEKLNASRSLRSWRNRRRLRRSVCIE